MTELKALFAKITKKENIQTDVGAWQDILGIDYEPDLLVAPETVEEIGEIMKIANKHKIPVYPLGSGSQFSQGVAPFKGGILLSLRNLKKITEYRPSNMSVEVEAGITLEELTNVLIKDNLYFPIQTENPKSTLGGLVARNGYGRNRYKYHTIRKYVLGVEFVSPEGELVRVGGRTVKNVSSLDVSQLITGSWGILGIITKITLRVQPLPEANEILELEVGNLTELSEKVSNVLKEPLSLNSMIFYQKDKKYYLQIELEGFKDTIQLQRKGLQEKYGFQLVKSLETKTVFPNKISLSLSKYLDGLKGLEKLAREQHVSLAVRGNITNGILEFSINEENKALLEKIAAMVQKLGGTLLAGGQVVVKIDRGQGYLSLLKIIKENVDPRHILVPQSLALKE